MKRLTLILSIMLLAACGLAETSYRQVEAPDNLSPQEGDKLNIRFKDAEVDLMLQAMSRNSGYYIYVDEALDLPERFTLKFKAESWQEALKKVAEELELACRFEGDAAYFDQQTGEGSQ